MPLPKFFVQTLISTKTFLGCWLDSCVNVNRFAQDGTEMEGEYSFLNSKDLITKDVEELRRTVKKRRENGRRDKDERDENYPDRTPMEEDNNEERVDNTEISSSQVTTLRGHSSEVFICAWSPVGNVLASGWVQSSSSHWTCMVAMYFFPVELIFSALLSFNLIFKF